MPFPVLMSGPPSLVSPVCAPPRFAPSEQYSMVNNTIVHRRVCLKGDVETLGACLVERGAILRGDIAKITLNNNVVLEEDIIIKPPIRTEGAKTEGTRVSIGTHTLMGKRTVCEAQSVGAFVVIEKDCCIGPWCIIGHGAWIRQGSVVPAGTVIEPFYVYEGNPVEAIGRLNPESHALYVKETLAQRMQSIVLG